MTVYHISKHSIPGNICLPLLEKSENNFMWSGKWSPCVVFLCLIVAVLNPLYCHTIWSQYINRRQRPTAP